MNQELFKLKEALANQIDSFNSNYYVPKAWNYFGYSQYQKMNDNVISVNPYAFYESAIDYILEHQEKPFHDFKKASYYSTMIRTNTTFDHDMSDSIEVINNHGFLETGSFVKMIAYLPTLKKIGINVIYLLPIMQFSQLDRKGELGSVYGVSNFFKLDDALFDPITNNTLTLDEQFKAFVQACHLFGMKVVLDIIPRTNSVNTSLLIDYPEWFYWIDYSKLADYKPPFVDSLPTNTNISRTNIVDVYASKEVQAHIKRFTCAPNLVDPLKWQQLVDEYKQNPQLDPLTLVRQYFNLTIAPAFSDQINDVQPAWTDVTFFRLYLDNPTILETLKITTPKHPYILFDTIKANLFKGKIINQPLWTLLSDILPYYIKTFDLDGARTDMGHALPSELTKLIISKAKTCKQDFYFIAEELSTQLSIANETKKLGYDLIIGDGFYHTHRFEQLLTRDFYYNGMCAPLQIFAAGETHDTPRLINRKGGFETLRFITILNQFAYNFVPFINSGQELLEKQPMNTGVDTEKNSAFMLDASDPLYGKLPLFDKFQFHYNNDYEPFIELLDKINQIKLKYQALMLNKQNVTYITTPNKEQIIFKYTDGEQTLYILGNASLKNTNEFNLNLNTSEVLYSSSIHHDLTLGPLDVMILLERTK